MSCKCAGHVSVGDPNRTSRAGERCHVDRGQTVKAPMQIYAYFSLAGDDYACSLIIGRRFESVVVNLSLSSRRCCCFFSLAVVGGVAGHRRRRHLLWLRRRVRRQVTLAGRVLRLAHNQIGWTVHILDHGLRPSTSLGFFPSSRRLFSGVLSLEVRPQQNIFL
jgi:hypothetical protein